MSKAWLVTRASQDLGRSIVEAALQGSDLVVATARQPKQLDDLVQQYGNRMLSLRNKLGPLARYLTAQKNGS